MRTTVTIDDDLLERAKEYSGIDHTGELIRAALTELVQRGAQKRLAELGGSAPDLVAPSRRRFGVE